MVRLKHRFIIGQVFFAQRHLQSLNATTTSSSSFGSDVTKSITIPRIIEILRQRIFELYGEMGLGEFGQQVVIKYYEQEYSRFIVIKLPRGYQKYIQFILSSITSIDDVPLTIRTLQTTSCGRTTMNKLKELTDLYLLHHPKVKELEGVEDKLHHTISTSFQENQV